MPRWLKWATLLFAATIVVVATYSGYLYREIRTLAEKDEARPADTIVVLGAAQYNGRPSPVLKARLDHAYDLYDRGLAHTIITTGSYGPDPNFSEAHVGTRYLVQRGIDEGHIITEQGSGTTHDSIQAVAMMMQAKAWKSALVVSDGFHLFRVKKMFEDEGIVAFTSPAPLSPIESAAAPRFWYTLREVFMFSAYRLVKV